MAYPRIDYLHQPARERNWRLGDELLSVEGVQLRGLGKLSTLSHLVSASMDGDLEVQLRRDGRLFTSSVVIAAEPKRYASFVSICSLWDLRRVGVCWCATEHVKPMVFFWVQCSTALAQLCSNGPSPTLTYIGLLHIGICGFVYSGFALKFMASFPLQSVPTQALVENMAVAGELACGSPQLLRSSESTSAGTDSRRSESSRPDSL